MPATAVSSATHPSRRVLPTTPSPVRLLRLLLQEAAAARVRLVCLRKRLDELRDLNADRQAHAEGLQERVAQAEVGHQGQANLPEVRGVQAVALTMHILAQGRDDACNSPCSFFARPSSLGNCGPACCPI